MFVTVMRRRAGTPWFSHDRTNVCQPSTHGRRENLFQLCETTELLHSLWTVSIKNLHMRNGKDIPILGNRNYLVIFRGCVQPTQKGEQADRQVPVTAPTGHKTEVIEQNHECTEAQENEHQNGDPWRALLCVLRHGRGVAAVRVHGWFVMPKVQARLVATLWGYASARFLLCCHGASVEPWRPMAMPHQLVSRKHLPQGRLKAWHAFW